MGCFSSKHVTRTTSLRDDFSMSLQRRTVGMPGLEDLFASSKNSAAGGDNFLALLCTANTVATKLREREEKLRQMSEQEEEDRFTSDEPAVANGCEPQPSQDDTEEPVVFHETINAWELMAGLEDADQAADTKRPHAGELDMSGNAKRDQVGGGNEGSSCVEDKRLSPNVQEEEDTPVDKQVIISSTNIVDATPGPTRTCPDDDVHLANKSLSHVPTQRLNTITETKPVDAGSDSPEAAFKGLHYSDSFRFKDGSFALPEEDDTGSKGVRRKARAKDLKPLEVPAFEFKDIHNWLQGNDHALYDSDPYETPKFGNYIRSIAVKARKDAGELDPDLVATLQETIDGMSAEEERILKQFVDEFLDQVQGGGGVCNESPTTN